MAAVAVVATAATAQNGQSLPVAPSVVMGQASDAVAWPAAAQAQYAVGPAPGSGFRFNIPATFAGPGGIAVEQAQDAALALSIDDAVALALDRNLRIRYDAAKLKMVRGDLYQVSNALVPSLSVTASTGTQETDLAAMGFKPSSIKIPGFTGVIPTIVKVDVTQVQLNVRQTLFNAPAWELLKGIEEERNVVNLDVLNGHGDVITAVTTAYLRVLADQASLENAQAIEASSKQLAFNAAEKRNAGVGTSLDEVRARVDYQTREQQRIAAETTLAKDTIQLSRIMGLPAGQKLTLRDGAPFAELADLDLERARATAYNRRKDYLSLQSQLRVAERERLAIKYLRLPTLAFGGYYGVTGETEGLYHGVFAARGTLQVPLFREATQRGQEEVAAAQLLSLRQRDEDLRVAIDGQIRSSLLDVQAAHELVTVAQSNVELARQTLGDERDRFAAGVDDNLPVLDAEASLAGAQAQLVQSLYQYNVAKLALARNTGIIETQYRTYLGTAH